MFECDAKGSQAYSDFSSIQNVGNDVDPREDGHLVWIYISRLDASAMRSDLALSVRGSQLHQRAETMVLRLAVE